MSRTVVAITGASSGIGETFARRFAPEHDLLLVARRNDRLQALARELHHQFGAEVETLAADLTDPDELERVALHIAAENRLILLVNNAGFGTRGFFWRQPFDEQNRMHQLHITATLRLTHAALNNLIPRDTGAIINVASVSAFVRIAGTTSYAATKCWMTAFTEGLALELEIARSSVQVQALCPGYTYSDFHRAMGLDRSKLAGEGFWLTSEYVVDAALEGLRRRRLFVIPNWRYRLITAFLSKLPSALRLALERRVGASRSRMLLEPPATTSPRQVSG